MRNILKKITYIVLLTSYILPTQAQKKNDVYVDKNGVMRWGKTNEEVRGFGENYTMPFAYAYRNAKKLGHNIERLIDEDVYDFARLGFDLFRVHVWDCEISDTLGNLLENDHLRLFDYMIMKMKERGIKFVITPIAYWGNGWPEPDDKTPGFSTKYGKDRCLTNPDAIKAQQNYLYQFLNHVNSYTKLAYKNDDDVIAFEVCNEPHHREPLDTVKAFINGMVASMRRTGCKKPILYNISHSIQSGEAYFNSNIQGGTFQWYPTGLGSQHELKGNLLPNADKYDIPYKTNPKFNKEAKIVYEFDAADVGRSYIYPALARSFREAGMQIATHFAYDPSYSAYANTEYVTHYMNLSYAPQKALALKIAGEVFHTIPTYKNFGGYPNDTSFGPFHISYENDLAEMITDEKFFYTNNTYALPPHPEKLKEIAGYGNSVIVQYDGAGAYFLDKLQNGLWRLEVMPDAIWVKDPFGRTNLKKEVAVINRRVWPITVDIPDLSRDFSIENISGTSHEKYYTEGSHTYNIYPGIYLLRKNGMNDSIKTKTIHNNILVNEFFSQPTSLKTTYLLHEPLTEATAGKEISIEAMIASPKQIGQVELIVYGSGWYKKVIKMEETKAYTYHAVIPFDAVKEGYLRYYIVVNEGGNATTWPAKTQGYPDDWNFNEDHPYELKVIAAGNPVYIFNAATDADQLSRSWIRTSSVVPLSEPGAAELRVNVEKLFSEDAENKNAEKIYDYSMRYYFGKKIEGRKQDVASAKKIVFKGRSLNDKTCLVQLALVMKDGTAFGGIISVNKERGNYELSIADMKKVKLVTLPRPYPTFLPYYFENNSTNILDLNSIECLQISIGPGIPGNQLNDKHGLAIESINLQ